MPAPNPHAFEFLLSRRSRPAKTLTTPVPDQSEILELLTVAARTPDHGKLEPWRFIVLNKPEMNKLADVVTYLGQTKTLDAEKIAKGRKQFDDGQLAIVVVEVQKESAKIPVLEQTYSAGAVCLNLLNAALAKGWGANWLTGWVSHDRDFMSQGLNLSANERIAGIIHIGTETAIPPERPRPNLDEIVTWA